MVKLFDSEISIEKMAAFLDGNLSIDEIENIKAVINQDSNLLHFMEVNASIDDYMQTIIESGFSIPEEISSSDFAIPQLGEGKNILDELFHKDNNFQNIETCEEDMSKISESSGEDNPINGESNNFPEDNRSFHINEHLLDTDHVSHSSGEDY